MEKPMKIITLIIILTITIVIVSCTSDNNSVLEYSGTIESKDYIISSLSTGKVESLFFDEGELIEKGDTLAIIEHRKLDLQLVQAEAYKRGIKAQIKMLNSGAREEDRKLATQLLIQAQANYKVASTNWERMTQLLSTKSISQKQYDDALLSYDIAHSKYMSAKQNVEKSKSARPEQIEQLAANLDHSEASILIIKQSINDCYITSPISGQVVSRFVEAGEVVSYLSSMFKIIDLTKTELTIYVSETDLAFIQLLGSAIIKIDAFDDRSFSGIISFISPEAEFTPKNIQTKDERTKLVFAVKIKIENPDKFLKPGMPADAVLKLKD